MVNKKNQKITNRIKNKKIQHISLSNFQRQLQKEYLLGIQINRPSRNLNKIKTTSILLPNHRHIPSLPLQLARTLKKQHNPNSTKPHNNRRRNPNKKIQKLLTKTGPKMSKRNKQKQAI